MRVLVTGAGGLLGGRLASLLGGPFDVVAARHEAPVPPELRTSTLDLASENALAAALDECSPEAVVHAAALADPDACEREPGRAETLNSRASRAIARQCRRRDIRLVALSTDLVFSGERPFWTESAPAEPLLVYGRTKRDGETAVLAENPGAAVVRVALVHGRGFGPRPTSSESVAWSLTAGRTVRLYTDQYRTPVDAESVASAIERLLRGDAGGLFHVGGPERVSRYDLGLRIARLLGLDAALIQPVRFAETAAGATRPADVSLDSTRAAAELGWRPRPLDVGIVEGRRTKDERF